MRHPLAPDFRRFLPAWLAFGSSVSFAAFALTMPTSIWGIIEPTGEINDVTPLVALMLSVIVYFAALAIGVVAVPFRQLFVGPRFPFVRGGYLVLAAVPLIFLVHPGLIWVHRLMFVAWLELFLAISLLCFVGLGRLFGAFHDEERSPPESQARAEV